MINMIVCADTNGGIGDADGNLLFDLPKDMKHFKSITSGKVIVMGRITWDSLPKKPLAKRKNYVLTRNKDFKPVGAKVIHSIEEILELGKKHDIFIIGGGELYEQLMPHADMIYATFVHTIDLRARTFFPEIDLNEWAFISSTHNEADDKHKHSFAFATYKRRETKKESTN